MPPFRIFTLLLVLPFLAATLPAEEKAGSISTKELLRRILSDQAPIILDVRSSEEYKGGHIHGAVNCFGES